MQNEEQGCSYGLKIGTLLYLDSAKEEKVQIPTWGGRFLIMEMDSLLQCRHDDFEVVAPGINSNNFMIVTEREGGSLRASPGS